MKRHTVFSLIVLMLFASTSLACIPTGFKEGGYVLTAALVNPASPVPSYVNANDCDIAIYYDAGHGGEVNGTWIFGGKKYGVFVNGDGGVSTVNVTNTTIQNTGTGPGTGVGIYYRAFSSKGRAVGSVKQNAISGYWSTGVVANGSGAEVAIEKNIIGSYRPTSEGLTGVQIGFGARATMSGNEIFHNSSYWANRPGDFPGIGVLVVGGPIFGTCPGGSPCEYARGVKVEGNQILQNDVGILLFNGSEDFTAPARPTSNKIIRNYVWDDECVNDLYQVAIADLGKQDVIAGNSNTIEGRGYIACSTHYNPNSITIDRDPAFMPVHAIK